MPLEKSTKSTAAGSLEETERNRRTDVEKNLDRPTPKIYYVMGILMLIWCRLKFMSHSSA